MSAVSIKGSVALVTGERTPLECFGGPTSARVAALLRERGVDLFTSTVPESFDGDQLFIPMAGSLPADARRSDLVVALTAGRKAVTAATLF